MTQRFDKKKNIKELPGIGSGGIIASISRITKKESFF